MDIVCLDLEGVLVPEIWVAVSRASGVPALAQTTRDEPNYDTLMRMRLDALHEHGLGLPQIEAVIEDIEPLEGARAFLDELRRRAQVIIVSDTFEQFAAPLMARLGYPTLFCNTLVVADDGSIEGWRMRVADTKRTTVRALHSMGFDTIAAGDSHNDLGMIEESKAGFLFRAPASIKADHPEVPAYDTYGELSHAIISALC